MVNNGYDGFSVFLILKRHKTSVESLYSMKGFLEGRNKISIDNRFVSYLNSMLITVFSDIITDIAV